MRKRPTIIDVAHRAGVSKGLVSLALNDRPGVNQATRERIRAAARELDWTPNLNGRQLSLQTSFAVGLLVRRSTDVIAADPFFPGFIAGIEQVLSGLGWSLLLRVVTDERAEEAGYRSLAADGRVNGMFLTDLRHGDPRPALLAELGVPAVTVGRPDTPSPCPAVVLDDRPGIAGVTRLLIEAGHTRIAHVAGDLSMVHALRRRDAYVHTMTEAGLGVGPVLEADFSAASGAAATRQLLELWPRPTAIVYASDPMAFAGLGVLQSLGIEVPAEMSITGFDGNDLGAYLHPPLTTVRADPVAWGAAAARTLLASIDDVPQPDGELPAAEVLVRGSIAPPPP